jgi:hypothetical protein
MQHIQLAAAASFILFGLWTIRATSSRGKDKKYSFSPFWTVAIAFFFAEMEDKTQLATVALAPSSSRCSPCGSGPTPDAGRGCLRDRRGDRPGQAHPGAVREMGSAAVFVAFGVLGIHEAVPERILTPPIEVAGLAALVAAGYLVARATVPQAEAVPEAED